MQRRGNRVRPWLLWPAQRHIRSPQRVSDVIFTSHTWPLRSAPPWLSSSLCSTEQRSTNDSLHRTAALVDLCISHHCALLWVRAKKSESLLCIVAAVRTTGAALSRHRLHSFADRCIRAHESLTNTTLSPTSFGQRFEGYFSRPGSAEDSWYTVTSNTHQLALCTSLHRTVNPQSGGVHVQDERTAIKYSPCLLCNNRMNHTGFHRGTIRP